MNVHSSKSDGLDCIRGFVAGLIIEVAAVLAIPAIAAIAAGLKAMWLWSAA